MKITSELITQFRQNTFRLLPDRRLKTPQDAVDFVNECGFAYLWPIKGITMPNLWSAVAGDRPVADDHDDPGHITWSWKDSLLDKRVWYYARIIKHKNTFVSNELIPYFYALSPNFGDPEEDFFEEYRQGKISLETKLIFEALMKEGPLDTISLRKAAHLTGKSSNSPFNNALDFLQMQLRLLPVAISDAGRWGYAFIYDLTHRYYPDLIEKAHPISESAARQKIVTTYLDSVGAVTLKEISHVFQWPGEIVQRTIKTLLASQLLVLSEENEDQKEPLICSSKLQSFYKN